MKRIYITESQMRVILREEFSSYLPNKGSASKSSVVDGENEVNTKDADENGNYYGGPTLDHAAKEKSRYSCYGTRSTTATVKESKKKLVSEENKEIQDNFTVNQKSIPTGTINYWKNQKKNGKPLTTMQDKAIKRVDNRRNQIKDHKYLMKNMGMENQFQNAGGQKNSRGTAHTKKNNGISITYEN